MPDVRKSTPPPVPVRITLEVAGPLTRAQIVARARQAFGETVVLVDSSAVRAPQPAPTPATPEDDPFAALERLSRQLKANSAGGGTTPDEIEALVHQVRAERRAAASSAE